MCCSPIIIWLVFLFALYFNQIGVTTSPVQEVLPDSLPKGRDSGGDILVGTDPNTPLTSEQLVWTISRSANRTFRLYFLRDGKNGKPPGHPHRGLQSDGRAARH